MSQPRQPQLITIASRASELALAQANQVKKKIEQHFPDFKVSIIKISTSGDKDRSLKAFERFPTGIFVRQVEAALLCGKADLAVHSLKDLPSSDTPKLKLVAFPKRNHPQDVLITRSSTSLKKLKQGAIIGTGSLRRQEQLLALRPDLKVKLIRGNVPTRIRQLEKKQFDAIVLAKAGINRLRLNHSIHWHTLPTRNFLPAAGQGTLAIQALRKNSIRFKKIAECLNDKHTELEALAERECMKRLKAGCRVPVAVYAKIRAKKMSLRACVYSKNGEVLEVIQTRPYLKAKELGVQTAQHLIQQGAIQLLAEWRKHLL